MDHIEKTVTTNTHLHPSIDSPDVALVSSSLPLADDVSVRVLNVVSEGSLPGPDEGQAHRLEEGNSLLIEESPHRCRGPLGVADTTSSPSNASPAGPSGVTSSFDLSVIHEVPTTPRIPLSTTIHQASPPNDDANDNPQEVASRPDTLRRLPGSSADAHESLEFGPLLDRPLDVPSDMPLIRANNGVVFGLRFAANPANHNYVSNRESALTKSVDVVTQELALRNEKLRSSDTDGVDGCAICHEALVNDPGAPGDSDTNEAQPASPGPTVAFPCAGKHLLHAQCLLTCLEQNTTCPSCGFDIDPGLRVQVLKHLRSPQVESMPEYPGPSPRTLPGPGSEVDTNKSLVRDPSPHVGDSDIDFERDFAPWFNPSNC